MKSLRTMAALCMAAAQVLCMHAAWAQIPPHNPGTICFTPQFWCWSSAQGPVGAPCYCPTPYGLVPGRLG